jgi:polyphosphate kinase 2 (PPK2 family)
MLVESGIHVVKIWLDISKAEQERRLEARREDPLKILKVSALDEVAQKKWKAYSKARDAMLVRTHTAYAPWIVVHTDKKKKARLAVISYLLHTLAPSKIHEHAPAPDPEVLFEFESQALEDGRLER